jgi:hypothetical protein
LQNVLECATRSDAAVTSYANRCSTCAYTWCILLPRVQVNAETNKLVVSNRRAVLEQEMKELSRGDVVEGYVKAIKPYGAFVEIRYSAYSARYNCDCVSISNSIVRIDACTASERKGSHIMALVSCTSIDCSQQCMSYEKYGGAHPMCSTAVHSVVACSSSRVSTTAPVQHFSCNYYYNCCFTDPCTLLCYATPPTTTMLTHNYVNAYITGV